MQNIRFDTHAMRAKVLSFLQTSFDTFYEHTIAVDQKGILTWISQSYCDFLHLETSPIGQHITDVIPNSYLPQVIATGKPVFLDLLYVRHQWVLVSVIPLHNDLGQVEGAFGFVATDRPSSMKPLLAKYNRLQSEVRNANHYQKERTSRYQLSQIAGQSEALKQVKHQVRQAARFDISVLLTGETGTGKELFAHALHNLSDRSESPFVSINVAAIPDTLIEAEFFGVAPGAFTGAKKEGRAGKLELAQDGTLFLDEIGDMPLVLQSKLLRVLQEKEFEKIGSNTIQKTNVRIVAATSRNLLKMVEDGEFRADLYYRLSGMPIHLPALRERPEDIEFIAERILDECCIRLNLSTKELATDALERLKLHHWPGNVRELYNLLERACILNESQTLICAEHIEALMEFRLTPVSSSVSFCTQSETTEIHPPLSLKEQVKTAEIQAIRKALSRNRGKRVLAAKQLGISRAALYNKIAQFNIQDS
ncbi:sigma-54-dependent Fis family transcriptional regulator [Nitrincola tibetensis]|uniref:Sigma-54-dependent Fis family transcriptional regulator n=1 Tax=Nitrincola tibetensis TaxID=2219697 RepID=A0A364NLI6_9GAMM|nr:sigma 54-interacting transcriptional regulator [Nitrincola tibetensis]RAU17932.1 sigma-54-dependent Fis family transcriptional regulator [Nitrincola tibetensis]